MQTKSLFLPLVAGILVALPASAYHIRDDPAASDGSGSEPLEWTSSLGVGVYSPVQDPARAICGLLQALGTTVSALLEVRSSLCSPEGCLFEPCIEEGTPLSFGLNACESNGDSGAGNPGSSGVGGLCFMSPGFEDASGTMDCRFASAGQGNSNGRYNPYAMPTAGVEACRDASVPQPVIQAVARNWYELTMQTSHPVPSPSTQAVSFAGQIGGLDCSISGLGFVYDEQFAYTTDSGHVAGFPTRGPSDGGYGGYWVEPSPGPSGDSRGCGYPFFCTGSCAPPPQVRLLSGSEDTAACHTMFLPVDGDEAGTVAAALRLFAATPPAGMSSGAVTIQEYVRSSAAGPGITLEPAGGYSGLFVFDPCGGGGGPPAVPCGSAERFGSADGWTQYRTLSAVQWCGGSPGSLPSPPPCGGPDEVRYLQSFEAASASNRYSRLYLERADCATVSPDDPFPAPDPCDLKPSPLPGSVVQSFVSGSFGMVALDVCHFDLLGPCGAELAAVGDHPATHGLFCTDGPARPVCNDAALAPASGVLRSLLATGRHVQDCGKPTECRVLATGYGTGLAEGTLYLGTFGPGLDSPESPHAWDFHSTRSGSIGPIACLGCVIYSPIQPFDPLDNDCDGVSDGDDNCDNVRNPDQANADGDAQGNACDADNDNDGVPDTEDNCPATPNPDQGDVDGDGSGNACDGDSDNDGWPDGSDKCPWTASSNADLDGDGLGDECDGDRDNDGWVNGSDNCADQSNPTQADADHDGVGNACDANTDSDGDGADDGSDNCPSVANPSQSDQDKDGKGDACDADADGDGADDTSDNCVGKGNPSQADQDGDGVGDACDPDRDGDGVADSVDNCDTTPNPLQEDFNADGIGDACGDADRDGVGDDADNCRDGYNPSQADADRDGAGDACDGPDADGDGVPDASDNCVGVPNSSQRDTNGDGVGDDCDPDDDGDGTPDGADSCPKTSNGCDPNSDTDDVPDGSDNCPGVWNPDQADMDGDGQGDPCDPDIDGDGVLNNADDCPYARNPGQSDADADGRGDACDADPYDPRVR